MKPHHEALELIARYADGRATAAEVAQLEAALREDAELRGLLLDCLNLDVALEAIAARFVATDEPATQPLLTPSTLLRRNSWVANAFAALTASMLFVVFFWQGGATSQAHAAVAALDRVIEAASQAVDRVYRIRVTEHRPGADRAPVVSGEGGRKPGIDGAELYVRGNDKFVLVRHYGNGTKHITGSDGSLGWAVPPEGHIHLSKDIRRFSPRCLVSMKRSLFWI